MKRFAVILTVFLMLFAAACGNTADPLEAALREADTAAHENTEAAEPLEAEHTETAVQDPAVLWNAADAYAAGSPDIDCEIRTSYTLTGSSVRSGSESLHVLAAGRNTDSPVLSVSDSETGSAVYYYRNGTAYENTEIGYFSAAANYDDFISLTGISVSVLEPGDFSTVELSNAENGYTIRFSGPNAAALSAPDLTDELFLTGECITGCTDFSGTLVLDPDGRPVSRSCMADYTCTVTGSLLAGEYTLHTESFVTWSWDTAVYPAAPDESICYTQVEDLSVPEQVSRAVFSLAEYDACSTVETFTFSAVLGGSSVGYSHNKDATFRYVPLEPDFEYYCDTSYVKDSDGTAEAYSYTSEISGGKEYCTDNEGNTSRADASASKELYGAALNACSTYPLRCLQGGISAEFAYTETADTLTVCFQPAAILNYDLVYAGLSYISEDSTDRLSDFTDWLSEDTVGCFVLDRATGRLLEFWLDTGEQTVTCADGEAITALAGYLMVYAACGDAVGSVIPNVLSASAS